LSRPTNYDESPKLWTRVYIDLPADVSDKLNVEAAQRRTSKKQLLQTIINAYFAKGETNAKGKK
jgi:hypothetical protein